MKKTVLFFFSILVLFACTKETTENIKISGPAFGTSFSAIYNCRDNINYDQQFNSIFNVINKSMSTYQSNSIISKLNRNETVLLDDHFIEVFDSAKEIHRSTDGIFDPTIGIMVNAWDFGPEGKIEQLDSIKILELMQTVDYDNITRSDNILSKQNKNTYLDFNAIAKGYAVDEISEFLESKNIQNYLVEIGGEIRAKGVNLDKQSSWKIGVENPNFDGTQSIFKAIGLKDASMATSGTYRKYKVDLEGNRYAHIINPKTGYPSKSNLLSVSVIAQDCMTADAYATAFKAMGVEKVQSFLKDHNELKAFLIFENDKNELETLSLNGFPDN